MTKKRHTEIERKFLVNSKVLPLLLIREESYLIIQFVIFRLGGWHARLRELFNITTYKPTTTLTIKGPGSISRKEYEFRISGILFTLISILYPFRKITKIRTPIVYKGLRIEVDAFRTGNKLANEYSSTGYVDEYARIAEIELESENQVLDLPDWIGREVTGQKEYSNYYMLKHGYPQDTINLTD